MLEAMKRAIYAVVDTNFLLHFRALESIHWPELLNATSVELVLSSVVLDEVSAHASVATSKKLRQRASAAGKRLRSQLFGKGGRAVLRDKVALNFADRARDAHYKRFDLDRGVRDNELLVVALLHRAKRRRVMLVTDDLTLQLRSEGLGIPVYAPPDDLRLPEEEDADEKELKTLRAVPRPKLELRQIALAEGGRTRPLALPLDEQICAAAVRQEDQWAQFAQMAEMSRRAARLGDPIMWEEELRREGSQTRDTAHAYVIGFASAVKEARAYRDRLSKMVRVSFVLANTGTGPAEGIRVLLFIQRGVIAEVGRSVPDPPPFPERPFDDDAYSPRFHSDLPALNQKPAEVETTLLITQTSSSEVRKEEVPDLGLCYVIEDHISKIQHGQDLRLPNLFVEFRQRGDVKTFQIVVRMHADNVAAPQEQTVNILAEPSTD